MSASAVRHPSRRDETGLAPPRQHWRQHLGVRLLALVLTAGTILVPALTVPAGVRWHVPLGGSSSYVLDPHRLEVLVGLLLLPAMRWVSYRKRDVLIIVLVPVWGALIAGLVVYRLLALPRRTWPPRPDELPRVARIPGGRGDYVLGRTYAEAEELRTAWCINPTHRHPYADGQEAPRSGCRSGSG
jgi:hypothetical protein